MAENCARPGCGHDQVHKVDQRISELLVRVTAERGHCGNGCRECSCPGYRTPEQQAAWEALMGEVGNWRMFSGTHYGSDDIHYGDAVADAADKVRSLYP